MIYQALTLWNKGIPMNKAEKRVLVLVIFLFSIGFLVRHSPWNLPEVGSVPVEFREYQEEQISFSKPPKIDEVVENKAEEVVKKEPKKQKKKAKVAFPISINTASASTLCAIPGVGPKMAEKIIEFRKTHGPLKKEADLLKISGIGKKKSKNILKCIKFD